MPAVTTFCWTPRENASRHLTVPSDVCGIKISCFLSAAVTRTASRPKRIVVLPTPFAPNGKVLIGITYLLILWTRVGSN